MHLAMNSKNVAILAGVTAGAVLTVALISFWPSRGRRPQLDDPTAGPHVNRTNESHAENDLLNSEAKPAQAANMATHALPWSRFRAPNGTGISQDAAIPIEWSDSHNLLWKTKLPGPGASSPIVTAQHVFVTSYSGYGEDQSDAGDMQQLRRHVSCMDRRDGSIVWSRTIHSEQREDPYEGMGLPEHGYATNSPVTDGQSVSQCHRRWHAHLRL